MRRTRGLLAAVVVVIFLFLAVNHGCTAANFYGNRKSNEKGPGSGTSDNASGGTATEGNASAGNASAGNATSNTGDDDNNGGSSAGNATSNTGDQDTGYPDDDDDGGGVNGNAANGGNNGGNASNNGSNTGGNASNNGGNNGGNASNNGSNTGGNASNGGNNGGNGSNNGGNGGSYNGSGNGSGNASNNGNNGSGSGTGTGSGAGTVGNASGSGTGAGTYGSGSGSGSGAGNGSGSGSGSGGSGSGSGSGSGAGSAANGGGNGVGTGGKDDDEDPSFFDCLDSNPDLFPIYVRAYDMKSYEQEVIDENKSCMVTTNGVNNFDRCTFLERRFDSSIRPKGRFTHFCMRNFDVSQRRFTDGFPKNDGSGALVPRLEWFALEAKADLIVLNSGNYRFKMTSDDGSLLYVDDKLVLKNDGLHSVVTKQNSERDYIPLAKGTHRLRLVYFQGPKFEVALQVYWSRNLKVESDWQLIPRAAFRYIKGIEDKP